MRRRFPMVAASGTTLLMVAVWWWWPPADDVAQLRVAAPDTASSSPVRRVAPQAVPHEETPVAAAVATVALPASPHQAAIEVLADFAGEGIVRCNVGDLVPDGPATGLSRAIVEDGILVGSVEEASGDARIHIPGDATSDAPRAIVVWQSAWPGEEGQCKVLVPELVSVSGWVVSRNGVAIHDAQVGNAVDGVWRVRADAGFSVECWRGTRCPLAARSHIGALWGPFESVVPDGPTSGIELLVDSEPPQDLVSYLEAQIATAEALSRMSDPLDLALADPRISDEARPMLEGWRARQVEERASAVALLADLR